MCVVRNDTKPSIRRIFLHNPSQGILCGTSHCIRLIQNNEFEIPQAIIFSRYPSKDLACRGEGFNLFTNNVDSTVVGGIEF